MTVVVAPKAKGTRRAIALKAQSRISPERFAEAFGATPVASNPDAQGALSMWQLSRELQARLSSSGGRPSLKGASTKIKVSILDEDLTAVLNLSDELRVGQYKASPAQIVSMVLHLALPMVSLDDLKKAVQA